ncbi:MAG: hypothetical protein A3F72_21560 [Bacteroidetes bacterium RIFCSPLOWO2_12_FULL_35_15]|nr:MAG: hypothetical protein A3F72_21560 [Bacteroidetes bacterium RIFCSPLOWO2_12_FULL_35_15]
MSIAIFFIFCLLPVSHCYSQSIQELEEKLKIARQNDDINAETEALINIGDGYELQGNHTKATSTYKEALLIADKYKQLQLAGYLWNKIADANGADGKQQDALDANQKSLSNYRLAKDIKGTASVSLDIGDNYFNQKKFEIAVAYYKQSLKDYEKQNDAHMMVNVLNRIGNSYSNWGNYDEAYNYLNDALGIASKNKMNKEVEMISKNMEIIKNNKGNFQKSQTEYAKQQTQQMVNEKEMQQQQINLLGVQNIKSIEEIGKLSIENQVKEFKIKAQQDEILKKQLETENKAKEIELLKKDKQIADADIQKQKLIILFVLICLVLALLFTGFILRSLRITRKQKAVIVEQKKIVDKKNLQITDSITYALTIQESILPKQERFKKIFKDSFIFFLPKDIVSGDFYWIKELDDFILVSVIDCTGHGVPGAFMSLHAYNHLEHIVIGKGITSPPLILDELNYEIVKTMGIEGDVGFVKNGMDMLLVKISKGTNEIEFSGAKNSGLIIRKKHQFPERSDGGEIEIIELKADPLPIGNLSETKFALKKEALLPGDMIYLFSDGYKDQKGGPQNKRFFITPFKEMLRDIAEADCSDQNEVILKKLNEWKGKQEQIDDICIMGLRI